MSRIHFILNTRSSVIVPLLNLPLNCSGEIGKVEYLPEVNSYDLVLVCNFSYEGREVLKEAVELLLHEHPQFIDGIQVSDLYFRDQEVD